MRRTGRRRRRVAAAAVYKVAAMMMVAVVAMVEVAVAGRGTHRCRPWRCNASVRRTKNCVEIRTYVRTYVRSCIRVVKCTVANEYERKKEKETFARCAFDVVGFVLWTAAAARFPTHVSWRMPSVPEYTVS